MHMLEKIELRTLQNDNHVAMQIMKWNEQKNNPQQFPKKFYKFPL